MGDIYALRAKSSPRCAGVRGETMGKCTVAGCGGELVVIEVHASHAFAACTWCGHTVECGVGPAGDTRSSGDAQKQLRKALGLNKAEWNELKRLVLESEKGG